MSLDVEIPVLRGFLTAREAAEWKRSDFTAAEVGPLLESLMEGDFKAVLLSPPVSELLTGEDIFREGEDLEAYLERRILQYIDGGTNCGQPTRELVVMVLAVSSLHMFVQSNWVGPPVSIHMSDLLPPSLLCSEPHTLRETVLSSLQLDGESVYSLVTNPFLLLLARVILTKCSPRMDSLHLLPWWTLRYISLHQQILEARSQQLLSVAHSSMDAVQKCQALMSEHKNLAIQFHLECAYTSLTYYEYQPAKEHIEKAQDLSQLDINLTGALGKRTRFQQTFLAQLILEVKRKQQQSDQMNEETSPTPTNQTCLPKITG